MRKILIPALSALLLSATINSAMAADTMNHMDHMNMTHSPDDVYAPAMTKMHKDMGSVKPTGNVDVDFVQGMIPHHQGAIDMAKIELEKGSDPEIQKLAKDIIKAQEVEIKQMNAWLKKHKK